MKHSNITIPAGRWTGYIWESDKTPQEVQVFNGESHEALALDASQNPFVIEALLRIDDAESWHISFVDGCYVVNRFDTAALDAAIPAGDVRTHQFIASFDDAPGKLVFKEYWREEEDPRCEGMPTLRPAEFVFVGFE